MKNETQKHNAQQGTHAEQEGGKPTGQAWRERAKQDRERQAPSFEQELKNGMDVVGSNGNKVGTVKSYTDKDFVVDRQWATDLHIPFGSIDRVAGHTVYLSITDGQVDKMHGGITFEEKEKRQDQK